MKKSIARIGIYCSLFLSLTVVAHAQATDTVVEFKPSGKLWGCAFGDFAYKGTADNLGTTNPPVGRGGLNQYTNMQSEASLFQLRRVHHAGIGIDV